MRFHFIPLAFAGALALSACSSGPTPEELAVSRADTAEQNLATTQAQLAGLQQTLSQIYGTPINDTKDLQIAHAGFMRNMDSLRQGVSTIPLPEVKNLSLELQTMADQLKPVSCGGDAICLEQNRDFIRLNAMNALLKVSNVLQKIQVQLGETSNSRERLARSLSNPYSAQ